MYSDYYGTKVINGAKAEFYGIDDKGRLNYVWWYGNGKDHYATLQRAEWTKHLHGNPPPGTVYGYFKLQMPDKKRINYYIYV